MRRIAEVAAQTLKWEQPSALKMRYELRTGDNELAATLHFRSSFGSFATAQSADGCGTFKRIGFFQTKATIRAYASDNDTAIFKFNTWSGGGTLELADGPTFKASTNFWRTQFGFESESGEKLIEFQQGGLLHLSVTVDIQRSAIRMAELPLMVTFGCYLVVMMNMDAAVPPVV